MDAALKNIVWIASYPKSGSTWTRVFLANFFRNKTDPVSLDDLSDYSYGESKANWFQQFSQQPVHDLSPREIMALRRPAQQLIARQSHYNVFVKTHNAKVTYLGHPTVESDLTAGMIYILRNPLDVVPSFSDHFGLSIDETIDNMASETAVFPTQGDTVLEFGGSWSFHVRSWTEQQDLPQLHIMRYEDLVARPYRTFEALALFLGLRPRKDHLARAIRQSSFQALQQAEQRGGFRERSVNSTRFFREGKAGHWRKILTRDQVARVVADHRDQMARFNYIPSGY